MSGLLKNLSFIGLSTNSSLYLCRSSVCPPLLGSLLHNANSHFQVTKARSVPRPTHAVGNTLAYRRNLKLF